MTTYLLVHGASHGGWCWSKVRRALQSSGTDIYTPTLTGLGERAHLASRDIGIETHIQDVVSVLECEDLKNVILVGHSYAGVVVTAVADRVPERIGRLVYLDAVVPQDGQCLFDCFGPEFRRQVAAQVMAEGEGWQIPVAVMRADLLGLTREEDISWVMPKLVPHPYRCFHEPVRLRGSQTPLVRRSYINCVREKASSHAQIRKADEVDYDAFRGSARGIEDQHELVAGHDAMITVPDELAALLRTIAVPSSNAPG